VPYTLTLTALDNLESIAATPGLNALMLGPGDLRVSLGLPSKKVGDYDDPRFLDAVDYLVAVSKRYRKPLMTVAFKVASQSDMWIKDFAMLLTSAGIITLTNGFRADLKKMEDLLQKEAVEAEVGNDKGTTNGARV
jgi:4-hydroxy-2-oxoheptanedioate aldolase